MPSGFKSWAIAGLGFALGVAAAQILLGTAGRALKG